MGRGQKKACPADVYVERHLFNEALLITPPIIVYSPVKSTLANPKEPWPYFPQAGWSCCFMLVFYINLWCSGPRACCSGSARSAHSMVGNVKPYRTLTAGEMGGVKKKKIGAAHQHSTNPTDSDYYPHFSYCIKGIQLLAT